MDFDKVEKLLSIANMLAEDRYPNLALIREVVTLELSKIADTLKEQKEAAQKGETRETQEVHRGRGR